MSYVDIDDLEVGDEIELSPSEISYYIGAVMAVGGTVQVDGKILRILSLPKKKVVKTEGVVEESKPKPVSKTSPKPKIQK